MIYLAGMDTLLVGFYLRKINLSEADYASLDHAKELAKAQAFKSTGHYINFQKMDFVMSPAGKTPYTYVLQNCDFTLKLAQNADSGTLEHLIQSIRTPIFV